MIATVTILIAALAGTVTGGGLGLRGGGVWAATVSGAVVGLLAWAI